jgi:hypothetical protein
MKNVIKVDTFNVNLAPDAFRRWAGHYYECKQQFRPPDPFSPVPYFLLCRAIELGIKAKHLSRMKKKQVKKEFGHNLIKAYNALGVSDQILTSAEVDILRQTNDIYSPKGFEYFDPVDALTAFSRYPDLEELDKIAKKLIST